MVTTPHVSEKNELKAGAAVDTRICASIVSEKNELKVAIMSINLISIAWVSEKNELKVWPYITKSQNE